MRNDIQGYGIFTVGNPIDIEKVLLLTGLFKYICVLEFTTVKSGLPAAYPLFEWRQQLWTPELFFCLAPHWKLTEGMHFDVTLLLSICVLQVLCELSMSDLTTNTSALPTVIL